VTGSIIVLIKMYVTVGLYVYQSKGLHTDSTTGFFVLVFGKIIFDISIVCVLFYVSDVLVPNFI
jgi:hypothetical protein